MQVAGVRATGVFAVAVSAALLAGALWFQHGMGLMPCQMCYWQRYAHGGVLLVGTIALLTGWWPAGWLAVGALLVSSGLGTFHAGVEQKWWPGPGGCTGGLPTGLSTEAMLGQMLEAPLVRCDAIPWELLGISMAGWNAVISGMAALAAAALLAGKRTRA